MGLERLKKSFVVSIIFRVYIWKSDKCFLWKKNWDSKVREEQSFFCSRWASGSLKIDIDENECIVKSINVLFFRLSIVGQKYMCENQNFMKIEGEISLFAAVF